MKPTKNNDNKNDTMEKNGNIKRKRISQEIASIIHPTRQAIINALETHGKLTTIQLEKILKESRYNLYHHLNTLSQQQVITEQIEGKVKKYQLTKRKETKIIATRALSKERKQEVTNKLNEILKIVGEPPLKRNKDYQVIIIEETQKPQK